MSRDQTIRFATIAQAPALRFEEAHESITEIENFLFRFGYLSDHKGASSLDARLVDALGQFQEFYGLDTSCEFDDATRRAMLKPRCGLPDTARARFSVAGPWTRRNITYAFGNPTGQQVGQSAAEGAVRSAFATWSAAGAGLRFSEVRPNQNPDIQVEWRQANDPDHDMRGRVIAHADYPPGFWIYVTQLPLPVHFDDTETTWAVGSSTDIESVAVHEIGHCLGLQHESCVYDSVMIPAYFGVRRAISEDDVTAVKVLYKASVQVINRGSGKSLDVSRQDIGSNGANVQQWDYGGKPNQQWTLERTPIVDVFWLQCVESGKSLDVRRQDIGSNGANVQQWDYQRTPNQQWRLEPLNDGFYWLRNLESGRALDVCLPDIGSNGANVQQWDYKGKPNQQWRFI